MNNLKPVEDVKLTAVLPQEMITAQRDLLTWAEQKLEIETKEAEELHQAYLHAKERKWKTSTLQAAAQRAAKRVIYYSKLKSAVQEGYYIVPNFPIDLFAIRTKRLSPKKEHYYGTWLGRGIPSQKPQELPETVGDYKNPNVAIYERDCPTATETNRRHFFTGDSWKDMEFPFSMARPEIMAAFSRAESLKIFDQFGICPPARTNGDPMIIGQIVRKVGWQEKITSFMIAWHLDTKTL